jgi:hypothetical protein
MVQWVLSFNEPNAVLSLVDSDGAVIDTTSLWLQRGFFNHLQSGDQISWVVTS